jgi:hypothetical protein
MSDQPLSTEPHLLEQIKVATTRPIPVGDLPEFVRDQAMFKARMDETTGRLVVSLSSYVLAEHLARETQTVTLRVPASWWQHFKRDVLYGSGRFRPTWVMRRWPARVRTLSREVTFTAWRAYPQASGIPKDLGTPVLYEEVDRGPGWLDWRQG